MTGNEIRKRFLDYFEKHHHRVVRSSSLVPRDDPTLLFTNAGMVQFKRIFMGEEKRDYNRAVTSQKCVRAGGKHNDLENVGYTARHHTFFEMLGNFSFGDYFKEKAVEFAWDLLTNGYGLPAERLWASVYTDDDEAYDLWHKAIGIPAERMVRLGKEDNFWAMGDTGPCGPCSEVHIDRGEAYGCGRPDCGVDCECDRFLEIWNLVFMQYYQDESGNMTPLPKPSIDTGMGLERLAAVLQQVDTNFETDLLRPIIAHSEQLSAKPFGREKAVDVAMKVIADHSRAAAFLINDGVLPSNEGRGYVLRRIMRRAIRYGRNIGLERPFLHRTVETVFDIMRPAYPELSEAAPFIRNVVLNEEQRFMETLDTGLRLLNDSLADLKAKGANEIPGELIFKLYDTFGFPVDIVQDVVRDTGMGVDLKGFESHMQAQRERSRAKVSFDTLGEAYKALAAQAVKAEFTGYNTLSMQSHVLLLVQDGREVEDAGEGETVEVVTAATPFYGESGGQVGDQGVITAEGLEVTVENTVKDPTGLIIHKGRVAKGRIGKEQTVTLTVDGAKRRATACNHTATHLLHTALRRVLGEHVKQAGSLVAPDRLRFDFTHFSHVSAEELERIETLVNEEIRANLPVHTEEMDAEQAMRSGAMALFEEKYGDRVRVVSMADFSKELCGGTHTEASGNIGLFKIIGETSVAAGVRRIEALTGEAALRQVQQAVRRIQEAAHLLRVRPEEAVDRVQQMLSGQKRLEKEVEQLKAGLADAKAQSGEDAPRLVNDVKVLVKKVAVDKPAAMRDLADRFRDRIGSGIVVLGSALESKALLIVVVTKDLEKRYPAGKIVKALSAVVGGGGGGRPDMAQAGGPQPEHLDAALEKTYEVVAEMGKA
ncbi:alanine--tRNA ligase [Desulfatitalea alkaliphila]|uniref:Alanine--tRNA ligase n=1 Tax=Desulfatitalea alkaliphila TaxID=2929485 RepID=A0AA41UJP8_9BACT|nr:alanine--tRNA ligase [Desulfatitalea alkaliphila]MCJ8502185.1 alanine--tRNA ligase [Desulfatitalea alkaliphila]